MLNFTMPGDNNTLTMAEMLVVQEAAPCNCTVATASAAFDWDKTGHGKIERLP